MLTSYFWWFRWFMRVFNFPIIFLWFLLSGKLISKNFWIFGTISKILWNFRRIQDTNHQFTEKQFNFRKYSKFRKSTKIMGNFLQDFLKIAFYDAIFISPKIRRKNCFLKNPHKDLKFIFSFLFFKNAPQKRIIHKYQLSFSTCVSNLKLCL